MKNTTMPEYLIPETTNSRKAKTQVCKVGATVPPLYLGEKVKQ
jgi:hypothetical protein